MRPSSPPIPSPYMLYCPIPVLPICFKCARPSSRRRRPTRRRRRLRRRPLSARPLRAFRPIVPPFPTQIFYCHIPVLPTACTDLCEAIEVATAAAEAEATAATPPAEQEADSCVPSHRPILPNPGSLLNILCPRPSHCLYRSVRGHRGGDGGCRGGCDGRDATR